MDTQRFAGKTFVVTGAGSGMGRQAAILLAEQGATTVLVGRRRDALDLVASEIRAAGGSSHSIPCDIGEEESVAAMADQIEEAYGHIDGLFANAGVLGQFRPLSETDLDEFKLLVATNVFGTLLSIKHCLRHMKHGAIVINASWTAKAVMPGTGAYAATKGALLAMMQTLAMEQGSRGIRVNSVSPGIILTPMAAEALDPALAARLAANSPLQRNGEPSDVAAVVAWLLSDEARFVTGQDIAVDGGFAIPGPRL